MKVFVVDLDICNGCYCCQIACKDEHVANDWTPYTKPQPDYGQFWVKVKESVRGTLPKVKVSYLPQMCLHCEDAECMKVCKPQAIYRRQDGLLVIDPAKCTGCKLCPDSCPYDMIYFNEGLNLAQKCTGCAHLLDDGWDVPRCVDACATEALKFGEASDFADLIARAEPLNGNGAKGRVYYLNQPRKFIAGTVYDPVEKEVIIGANCTLTETATQKTYQAATDDFGDFWFNDLPTEARVFSLTIEKNGKKKCLAGIDAAVDVNLGDIPMHAT